MRPSDWSPVGLDSDPTPGDPVLVLAGGQDYLEVAGSIDDAAGAMSRLDVAGTVSQAVDALMETKEDTVSEIRRAHSRYQATGEALVDYARTLDRVQAETLAALEKARSARDAADSAAGSRDRYQDLADQATDVEEKREYQQQADAAGGNADDANGQAAAARSDIEGSVADRDRAASDAVSRIEDITSGDDLNDSWWDDWGSKVVAAIADIADMISTIAGLLAIVVAFIPVVGTALAGVLIVVAAVAAIVSALANITLAATGERSWAEAGIAIAGAALSVIGLGGAAKAATGLSKAAFKQGMKSGLKSGAKKAWCKVGFGTCFTAGTLVRTVDGDKPIEEIRAGDKVYAHDLATGADELQLVMETFVRTTTTLFHLTIAGHTVTTTDEHPFMVANMGWILVRDLQPGDILVTPDGTVTLDRIDIEHRDPADPVTVYNVHVETHHNYYVLAGDLPVLVHNAAGHGGIPEADRIADAADIAAGHAGSKHAGDFPGMSVDDLTRHTSSVMSDPARAKDLSRLRRAYQGKDGSTIVIHDPMHEDVGTVFRRDPTSIDDYWENNLT
ncbi:polymorphic toxin-type HINT domain-containing protein [Isoptericola sp. NPDC057559]|uniref:polymorphic toxin-type HINT domain-containing protein n=1 Tax=Isoptericola sp. NPDC057559 TaxID=3346168 RepID=UPI0036876ABB